MFIFYIIPVLAFIGFYFRLDKFRTACIASLLFNVGYLLFLGIVVFINHIVHLMMGA
jgi:hypothetical protein